MYVARMLEGSAGGDEKGEAERLVASALKDSELVASEDMVHVEALLRAKPALGGSVNDMAKTLTRNMVKAWKEGRMS